MILGQGVCDMVFVGIKSLNRLSKRQIMLFIFIVILCYEKGTSLCELHLDR